jgi:FtsZ-binding cell division protein ZapB
MSFEQNIQQWVSIDNQIKLLNDKIHELREKKHKLSENITSHVESNDLRNATVQISDGKLRFVNTKVSSPLTFKYVEKTLGEVIKNQTQVKQIVEYLKQHREIKIIHEIKRISNN